MASLACCYPHLLRSFFLCTKWTPSLLLEWVQVRLCAFRVVAIHPGDPESPCNTMASAIVRPHTTDQTRIIHQQLKPYQTWLVEPVSLLFVNWEQWSLLINSKIHNPGKQPEISNVLKCAGPFCIVDLEKMFWIFFRIMWGFETKPIWIIRGWLYKSQQLHSQSQSRAPFPSVCVKVDQILW